MDRLTALIAAVNDLYAKITDVHIHPRDLRKLGLPQFHEYIFEEKQTALLIEIFGGDYQVSEDTGTRRIDSVAGGSGEWQVGLRGEWQVGLRPHLDVFVHPFAFTVNFWVPFRDCGIDAMPGNQNRTVGPCPTSVAAQIRPLAGTEPDSKWPNMYRVRLLGSDLSDLVNLTREKDAP